jgi:hypothetical protein
LAVALGVGIPVIAAIIICIVLFIRNKRRLQKEREAEEKKDHDQGPGDIEANMDIGKPDKDDGDEYDVDALFSKKKDNKPSKILIDNELIGVKHETPLKRKGEFSTDQKSP